MMIDECEDVDHNCMWYLIQHVISTYLNGLLNYRPDISALQNRGAIGSGSTALNVSTLNPNNPYQGPALEDLEAPKRQTSLDGEAIKIVIHDVDSGPLCASKRRVILNRDPSDKAHRSECNFSFIAH